MHNNASRIVSFFLRFLCMDVYSEEQTCHVEYSLHGLLYDCD